MAAPIELDVAPCDPRADLIARLRDAPQEHAEALLAGYEVLQGLHDRGALEIVRGLLGSGDDVLEVAVDAIKGPQAIRTIRNLVILLNVLGSIDPKQFGSVVNVIPQVVDAAAARPEPQSLWQLFTGLVLNRDVRRALATIQNVLATAGRMLSRVGSQTPLTG